MVSTMTKAEQVTIPEGYKQTEVGVIPEDWEVAKVGDEFDIKLGKMLDADKNLGVSKPYLGNKAVQWGKITLENIQSMRMTSEDLIKFRLRVGDLLVCEGGEIGRGAIWAGEIDECYYQKALHRLRPIKGYSSQLMLAYLRFWTDHGMIDDFVSQTSIAHLTREKFISIPLLIPSKEEQTAIANALSDVDNLIAALKNLIAKKSAIKTAAMQQLLTGKKRLPGFAKLNEAQAETQSQQQPAGSAAMAKTHPTQSTHQHGTPTTDTATNNNSQTARPGYKQTELGEIPEDWEVVELGDIAEFYKGKGLPKNELVDSGAYKCIHYGELFTHYSEKITEIKSRTDTTVNTFLSKSNDILMPTSDVTPNGLGTASGLKEDGVILGGDVLVIRPKQGKLDSTYFAYIISISKNQIMQLVSGSTVYHLYGSDMATFKYAGPRDIKEQTAIANVLSDMDAELDALQQRLEKTQSIKQGMMQELLTGKTRLIKPLEEVVHE